MRPPLVQPAKGAPIVHTEEEVLGNAEDAAPPDPDFLGRQSLAWCAGGGWSVLLGPGAILVLALLAPLSSSASCSWWHGSAAYLWGCCSRARADHLVPSTSRRRQTEK